MKIDMFIRMFIVTILTVNAFFPSEIFADGPGKLHYSYINLNEKYEVGDTFYINSSYFKCQTKQKCPIFEATDTESKAKRYAYFLKRKDDGVIIPVFLQCYPSGNATMSMAEDLIPKLNAKVLKGDDCLDEQELAITLPDSFVGNTLKAVRSYEGNCPKEKNGFLDELYDSFEKDIKNAVNILSLTSQKKVEAGCFTNLIANATESLYQTLKMFFWDIPKLGFNVLNSTWNYFFDKEEENSTAMLYSSVMSSEMANALADWDIAKFYSLLRKNFMEFLKGIKEYYTEILGCSEWSGLPYASQCLKKMDWSCPTWENGINLFCGALSQLGVGYFLGGMLGTAKSALRMHKLRKTIANNPKEFGVVGKALEEFKSSKFINSKLSAIKEKSRRGSFKARRSTKILSDFVNKQKDDIKFIMGLGEGLKNFVKATPITMPFHYAFQKGQSEMGKKRNEASVKNIKSKALDLGRSRALRLDNIQVKFDDLFDEFKRLQGSKFNSTDFKQIKKELMKATKEELEKTGVKVDHLDNGGLRISKGSESFDYNPKFEEKLKSMPEGLSDDGIKEIMTNGDLVLGKHQAISLPENIPAFWDDFIESAKTSRGLTTVKSDGLDGFVYLGHFSAQSGSIPDLEDCSGKLDGVELIRSQDITNIDTDGNEEEASSESKVSNQTQPEVNSSRDPQVMSLTNEGNP